jgi:CHASE2 domain-containing sensor protein
MASTIFLNLGAGSFHSGFDQVRCRLVRDAELVNQTRGSLPGNSRLQDLHQQWQSLYDAFYCNSYSLRGGDSTIEIDNTGITGYSVATFQEARTDLERCMRLWLDSTLFNPISSQLRTELRRDEDIVIIIETEDDLIHRLPWHFWSLLKDFSRAEIAFSLDTYQRQDWRSTRTVPRVLAIFGDSTGFDNQADAQLLQQLQPGLVLLNTPSMEELTRRLNDREGWDLLFFAGHSDSTASSEMPQQVVGSIRLNDRESVTLTELKYALDAAIKRGLKLAIFNSCSGLGMATSLAELNIPTVIVMREVIPNRVAQDFLRGFLSSFVEGNSLLYAVREAKQRLEAIERVFPCATWLPVVFWNPAVELPTWESFHTRPRRISWWHVGAIALTTLSIWVLRSQGILEGMELAAYDWAMNNRVIAEVPDSRLLIVGVNEEDFRKLGKNESLRDRVVLQALQKLQQHQPKAIGLDIYRDQAFATDNQKSDTSYQELLKLLQQQGQIISPCLMAGSNNKEFPLVPAPAGVQPAQVGFTNFVSDDDGIIRRQILGMAADDQRCNTDHALSLRLALRYLEMSEAKETVQGDLQIGTAKLAVFKGAVGAYRSAEAQENLRGFQVMLNYRNTANIAPQVSLDDVLKNRVDPALIKNKIVLIGYVADSMGDKSRTAYGGGSMNRAGAEMPGVIIHAHMVSNILSHVLDQRPLLTTWADWGEILWIGAWGAIGGHIVLGWRGATRWIVGGGVVIVLCVAYGLCFNYYSIWIPLVPSGICLLSTPIVVSGLNWLSIRGQPQKNYVSVS